MCLQSKALQIILFIIFLRQYSKIHIQNLLFSPRQKITQNKIVEMLRGVLLKCGSFLNAGYNVSSNPSSIQTVRFRRKPRWIPTARSKMFRVPERTIIPEDEKVELLRLNGNYKLVSLQKKSFV